MSLKIVCEYFENPFGIDNPLPRFSWKETEEKEGKQVSYQIIVSRDEEFSDILWDTGVVMSDENVNIIYAGKELQSVTTYYYKVKTKNSSGKESVSNVGYMTMGLMDPDSDWKAPFEGIPVMAQRNQVCRMEYDLENIPAKAYSFVISPNYYVLTVNGKKTTDTVLNNANTDPNKRIPYLMEDITDLLKEGKNVFGIDLGNGWPGISASLDHGDGIVENQFSVQILFIDKEGNRTWYYTMPKDWYYTFDVPMLENSIYGGEIYDARKEIKGWDTPEYVQGSDNVGWKHMVEFEGFYGARIVSQRRMEPITINRIIKPVNIFELPDGSYTFDFGQNFAGWARLKIKGERGQKIVLSYAENINEDHTVNKLSLRKAKAIDTYILSGEGMEVYEPKFTFHGFRYVNVSGLKESPGEDTLMGCFVRSEISKIGSFECSEELLNQLYSNVNWTEASNQHGIPTDCPQRDERLGWTNDMTVRNETALYSFDLARLYEKWMGDICDAQGKNSGAFTDTAPFLRYGSRPQDPVAASPVLIPWNVYKFYNDKKIIQDNYEANKRWGAYLCRISDDYIMPCSHMGDWAGPMGGTIAGVSDEGIGGGAVSVITPTTMVATAYFYYVHILLAKQAGVLGKKDEKKEFFETAAKIKDAFIEKYYNAEKKYFCSNSQGCNVIALYMGLVPEEDIDAVMENLVEDIVTVNNTHVTTGNLCSRYILEVLFRYGYTDVAYDLMMQDTYPSWGFMVRKGATTMWERWEEVNDPNSLLANMASGNHPMNGAFGIAFEKYLGGISPDPEKPGFKNIIIKPYIPSKLDYVKCSIETMRGKVRTEWKKDGTKLNFMVKIPFNTTADIYVPSRGDMYLNGKLIGTGADGYYRFQAVAGEYHFVSEL